MDWFINQTGVEIGHPEYKEQTDQIVYKLYGLAEEEIKIVEGQK